ncbi:Sulfur carrier protein FdhD [bioreactor metagenome]|uniref:Sulfur carrier protein FdhD n=2 Tax=root TaxID=1 RepID=A0A644Z1C4_9ZZZZ
MIFLNPLNYIECEKVENSSVNIEIETIYEIMDKNLNSSKLFKDTGGVHSVSIFNQNKGVITCEDVARHNAMDKAIGHCVLEGINLKDKIILVSGRISLEMMLKAAQMQIPVIISKSAPTNLSIELANRLNITLIGFVRGERMNIYTNPQRVLIKV